MLIDYQQIVIHLHQNKCIESLSDDPPVTQCSRECLELCLYRRLPGSRLICQIIRGFVWCDGTFRLVSEKYRRSICLPAMLIHWWRWPVDSSIRNLSSQRPAQYLFNGLTYRIKNSVGILKPDFRFCRMHIHIYHIRIQCQSYQNHGMAP